MPDSTIEVSIPRQKVSLLRKGGAVWTAPCSTAELGTGSSPGSFQTPTGLFHIAEKIGAGAAPGTIFKSRVPTGEIWIPGQDSEEDLILTRILWLAGNEAHNRNTKERYIYFHGTNHEHRLGSPASHGCIRLANSDILTLFDLVDVGTHVKIF